jgi:hypothetical protein
MSVTLTRHTGVLELAAERVHSVLAEILGYPSGGGFLRAEGLVDDAGRVDSALGVHRAVIGDPASGRLRLVADTRVLHGRLGAEWSILVTPADQDGRARVVPMGTGFVPKAVLRAVGLIPALAADQSRTPLTWSLTTAPRAGDPEPETWLEVFDEGRELRARSQDGDWRRVSATEVYCEVAALVASAIPSSADNRPFSTAVGGGAGGV